MWTDIIGFEQYYQINEYGDILSKTTNQMLSPYVNNKGYKCIDLYNNGIVKKCLIHRLVALHFVPNPNNYPIVLHRDNVKLNTYYKNLERGTCSQNNAQAIRDGLNKVPRPDNTKIYEVYNNYCCYRIKSINEIIKINKWGNDSTIRNYIRRKTPISTGVLKGYYIRLIVEPTKPFTAILN